MHLAHAFATTLRFPPGMWAHLVAENEARRATELGWYVAV
jgi:hypothetical protein